MRFRGRVDAGKRLANVLRYLLRENPIIIALPRGGVVLAAEIARELNTPLDVLLIKKITHPLHEEYAIGAVVEGEAAVYNARETAAIDHAWLLRAEHSARELIAERRQTYYGEDLKSEPVIDKTVILVDDGIATGLTMKTAILSLRNKQIRRLVVAVPVAPKEVIDEIETLVDEVVVLESAIEFKGAVGSYYQEFGQVEDAEVVSLLQESRKTHKPENVS